MKFLHKVDRNFLIMSIFSLIGLRCAIYGANIGDALFLISIVGIFAYEKYLDNKKEKPVNDEVKSDLETLKNVVSSLSMKHTKPAAEQVFKRMF